MGRRLIIDMFPGGVDENVLRRGDICDQRVIRSVLGLSEDLDESQLVLQNPDAYTRHYIGDKQLFHTFYRSSDMETYRYAGLCRSGAIRNLHPEKAQRVFLISQCHADSQEEFWFYQCFAKAVAREIFRETRDIPIVPHIYFPSFLKDSGYERNYGMEAGHLLMRLCDRVVCATVDGVVSDGMRFDLDYATTELALDVQHMSYTRKQAQYLIDNMETELKQDGETNRY